MIWPSRYCGHGHYINLITVAERCARSLTESTRSLYRKVFAFQLIYCVMLIIQFTASPRCAVIASLSFVLQSSLLWQFIWFRYFLCCVFQISCSGACDMYTNSTQHRIYAFLWRFHRDCIVNLMDWYTQPMRARFPPNKLLATWRKARDWE